MKSTATGMTLPYYAKIKGSKVYHLVNIHSRWRNDPGYDRANCESVALPSSDREIESVKKLPSGAQLCKKCEKLLELDGPGPFFHDYTDRDYEKDECPEEEGAETGKRGFFEALFDPTPKQKVFIAITNILMIAIFVKSCSG